LLRYCLYLCLALLPILTPFCPLHEQLNVEQRLRIIAKCHLQTLKLG
jgi:hypothetical protein